MIPVTEIRTLPVSSSEPEDRTTGGTVLGPDEALELGIVDTTDEAQDLPVSVFWWRVSDIKGNSEIYNIRVWLEGTEELTGTDAWYMDITDTWTQGKTPVQVKTGTPGTAPLSEPDPNLTRRGGGNVTGITNDQTSGYIYITGTIGVNETTGEKTGLKLMIMFDYH
ncbi:hypothetical protein LLG96_02060 [bacterium]|nr:hypothetical protein [bacterium]